MTETEGVASSPEDQPKDTVEIIESAPLSRAHLANLPSRAMRAQTERIALAWLVGGAMLIIIRLLMPVGIGVLLGALMAFTVEPLYKRLERATKRPGLASLIVVLSTAIVLLGSFALLVTIFVTKGVSFGSDLVTYFSPTGQGTALIASVTKRLAHFGVNHDMIMEKLRNGASDVASRAAESAAEIASLVAEGMLALFFLLLTMHLFLRKWEHMLPRAQTLFPLRPDYTRALFQEFRKVGRTTLQGTVVTGVAQGVLAGIGFALAGLDDAAFFGAATAVASLIPAVGTMLVWVPAGIYLIVTGHTAGGIFALAWGVVFVVGMSDYVIRPRLVGGDESTPALLTFAALLGGVEVFGLQGLIVGPLLMSLALAVVRIYEREAIATRRAAADPEAAARREGIESALGNIRR